MTKNAVVSKRCLKCKMLVSVNAVGCITCGQKIKMEIPLVRSGECVCHSGKLLLLQLVDLDGSEKFFCPDCISPHHARLLAELLIDSGAQAPNQEVKDRVFSLAGFNGRHRYSESQKLEGLTQFIGTIHSARERANINLPQEE